MTFIAFTLLLALSPVISSIGQASAPLSGSVQASPAPAGLAAPIAAKLGKSSVRVVVSKGPATLEFWWVDGLSVKAGAAAPSWADVEEGALVGAVNVSTEFRDIRARVIKPGVYTLRYGIQPDNGDHLGVSPFRQFLLLSPAALDTDPQPRGHDGTVEISKEAIGGSHPAVWSIDPPAAKAAVLQPHKTELDHDAIVMEIPVVRDAEPAGTLRFGVVLIGKIEA